MDPISTLLFLQLTSTIKFASLHKMAAGALIIMSTLQKERRKKSYRVGGKGMVVIGLLFKGHFGRSNQQSLLTHLK